MHPRSGITRRAAAALAAMTFLVMASVGSCHMPQPKIPSLGLTAPAATGRGLPQAGTSVPAAQPSTTGRTPTTSTGIRRLAVIRADGAGGSGGGRGDHDGRSVP